jgi:hypothetical protein
VTKMQTARLLRQAGMIGVAALTLLAAPLTQAMAQGTEPPAEARVMTPAELLQLYQNRSWQWESGAGYMQEEGRRFTAWVDDANGPTWAEGRWVLTDAGRMCMRAVWYSSSAAVPAETCFSHRIDGTTIYQKSEPAGQWYVFRSAAPKATDEASKLVRQDLVSERLAVIKTGLERDRLAQGRRRP